MRNLQTDTKIEAAGFFKAAVNAITSQHRAFFIVTITITSNLRDQSGHTHTLIYPLYDYNNICSQIHNTKLNTFIQSFVFCF